VHAEKDCLVATVVGLFLRARFIRNNYNYQAEFRILLERLMVLVKDLFFC